MHRFQVFLSSTMLSAVCSRTSPLGNCLRPPYRPSLLPSTGSLKPSSFTNKYNTCFVTLNYQRFTTRMASRAYSTDIKEQNRCAFERNINGHLPIIDPSKLPSHFTEAKEREWDAHWNEIGLYQYDADSPGEVFSIDTPPPTASGSLHIGHLFSYSHTDMIARYQRMRGRNVFYPMGWDDNGLPTERRVQNYYHVWCSENVGYEEGGLKDLVVPSEKEKKKNPRRLVSRKNFVELCEKVTKMDEIQFKELFTRVGLSVDWREEYATISRRSRRVAQLSFLDLYKKGHVYQSTSPTLWDIDFQTAIAQAEVEDRETDGAFHKIAFGVLESPEESLVIATTRPELLPACVAVAAHPDDPRYQHLFGKHALTPLFYSPVPIFPSELVDKEKGTGILMICTFGDVMDVEWWKQKQLPLRQIIGKNGKLMNDVTFIKSATSDIKSATSDASSSKSCNDSSLNKNSNNTHPSNPNDGIFLSIQPDKANENYALIKCKGLIETRKMIVEMLKVEGGSAILSRLNMIPLLEPPKPLTHPVKYFEKGTRPLELIPTKQWFLRLMDKKEKLLKQGSDVKWKPDFMVKKYNDWVQGLNTDWCISRQRFFGVPFPVYYPIDSKGTILYDKPILPSEEKLPIDPLFDTPDGFLPEQRDQPGGFSAEVDVFDTWWTSSMTPQIVTGWQAEEEKHAKLYPLSLRPQSHEIIRTWAFYTIAKSLLHENSLPWHEIAISGWIVDKDGSKVSKSKGNSTVSPMELLDKHFADGVRYWTGSSRLGSDTVFQEAQMAVGRRLVTKLFNAGKLAFSYGPVSLQQSLNIETSLNIQSLPITCTLDLALLAQLKELSQHADEWFKEHNFGKVMRETEIFFWSRFTDNYLEMIKMRAKDGSDAEKASAILTTRFAMSVLLRLFAPLLPHITEEVWSWALATSTGNPSIHKAPYPSASDFSIIPGLHDATHNESLKSTLDTAIACADVMRKVKAEAGLKFSAEIQHISIKLNAKSKLELESSWNDILFAVRAQKLTCELDESLQHREFVISIIN